MQQACVHLRIWTWYSSIGILGPEMDVQHTHKKKTSSNEKIEPRRWYAEKQPCRPGGQCAMQRVRSITIFNPKSGKQRGSQQMRKGGGT